MVKYELRKRTLDNNIVDLPEGAIVIECIHIKGDNKKLYAITYLERVERQ